MPQLYGFQNGTFDQFIKGWTDFGSYFDHITMWISIKKDNEKMKASSKETIEKIVPFLGGIYECSIKDQDIMKRVLLRGHGNYPLFCLPV